MGYFRLWLFYGWWRDDANVKTQKKFCLQKVLVRNLANVLAAEIMN